jgi:hypothetical protein
VERADQDEASQRQFSCPWPTCQGDAFVSDPPYPDAIPKILAQIKYQPDALAGNGPRPPKDSSEDRGLAEADRPTRGTILPMKRLRLWLPIGMAVLSPLLCLIFFASANTPHGTGLGWANNSVKDREYSAYGLALSRGELFLGSAHETWPADSTTPQPESDGILFTDARIAGPMNPRTGLYHHSVNIRGYIIFGNCLCLPWWSPGVGLMVISLLLIALNARNRLTARKIRRGICPSCGYDLHATSHRCPECGIVPAQIKSPAP